MKSPVPRLFPGLLAAVWLLGFGTLLLTSSRIPIDGRGDFLIRNTVRIALVYWALAAAFILAGIRSGTARLCWTLGFVAYAVHVAVAFEYAHHWSHAEAFEHVRQAGGFGEGIFASYFFTLLWLIDVIWWWLDRAGYESRPRLLAWVIHGFMLFMIVNGAIIFENGPIRWVSLAILGGLACLAILQRHVSTGQ